MFCVLQKVTLGNLKNIFLYKSSVSNYIEVLKRTAALAVRILTECLSSKDKAKLDQVQEQLKDLFQSLPSPGSKNTPSLWLKELLG